MDQHPVPQNISSYEFRLVGDMTLKQFFQLAGGAAAGFLIYSLPLPFFIKWPLIGLAIFMGIMLAFVPVSGRPFSQWLLAFVRAIYSPTEYAWKASPIIESMPEQPTIQQSGKQSPLDAIESQIFSRVTQLFSQNHPTPTPTPAAAPVTPPPSPVTKPEPPPRVILQAVPVNEPNTTQTSTVTTLKPSEPVHVDTPQPAATQKPEQNAWQPNVPTTPVRLTPQVGHTPISGASPAAPATHLTPSTYPGIIVGQVVNNSGQGIEAAIIEISDAITGIPARALKTNKLGQFQTATPLTPGQYTILAEKEGFTFNPVALTMENKIVQPILITAQ